MGSPLILVDNLYSVGQYPDHVVSANAEAAGHEAFRLGNGRRSLLDYATPTTANTIAWWKVRCDRVRAANCVVLDRGHNLAGRSVLLQVSQDDFTTFETIATVTLPAATAPGAIDDPSGVRTEEGAWILRYPLRAGADWRLYVPAVVDFIPQVVGLYLGLAWAPDYFVRPMDDEGTALIVAETQSETGWVGRGSRTRRRQGVIRYEFRDLFEYEEVARYHLQLHADGAPTWLVFDDAAAQRACCAIRTAGFFGVPFPTEYGFRTTDMDWMEHEPLV